MFFLSTLVCGPAILPSSFVSGNVILNTFLYVDGLSRIHRPSESLNVKPNLIRLLCIPVEDQKIQLRKLNVVFLQLSVPDHCVYLVLVPNLFWILWLSDD